MKETDYIKLDKYVKIFKICQAYNIKSYQTLINFMVNYEPHEYNNIVGADEDTSLWIFKKEWCPLLKFIIEKRQIFIDYFKN